MELIHSRDNKKIKEAAGLQKSRERDKTGLFLAEGIRLVEMAASSDYRIRYTLATEEAGETERAKALLGKLASQAPVYFAEKSVYDKAAGTVSSQGILCVLEQKKRELDDLEEKEAPLYLVLDQIQDPGNLGTILRTADAAGVDGVILMRGTADLYNPKVVRSAMGSLFHLPVVSGVNTESLLAFLERRHIRLLATALDASAASHFETDFRGSVALIMGNEGNGVSSLLLEHAKKVYIPMFGAAESLNAAVSAGIVLYETVRQRHPEILSR
ncbi:MAG: RNA methyltransferase [Selenomonadaceae bacterium]|nr:RNA methyltransferase [Selenomonadaceae bacterium]